MKLNVCIIYDIAKSSGGSQMAQKFYVRKAIMARWLRVVYEYTGRAWWLSVIIN